MVALANGKWKDRVELKIYYLQQDPTPALKYEPILGATVIIGGRVKITDVTLENVNRALTEFAKETEQA